jgi:hypothetical protein
MVIKKVMPFHVFQSHCDDRKFDYMGQSGKFFVTCKRGLDKCNFRICPVWAVLQDAPGQEEPEFVAEVGMTLRQVNLSLREGCQKGVHNE